MPVPNATDSEIADAQGGFSTSVDMGTLRVKAWGFWSKDIGLRFGSAVYHVCHMTPGIRKLEFDMAELKPMRDEGQESFGRVMRALGALPILEVIVSTSSHLTKLQLLRIAREEAPEGIVRFVNASEYS